MNFDANLKEMKSILTNFKETEQNAAPDPSDNIDSGEPIKEPENHISLSLDNYDYYRLGLILASEKMYDASQAVSSTDKKLMFYSRQEMEDVTRILKKHGVKYKID